MSVRYFTCCQLAASENASHFFVILTKNKNKSKTKKETRWVRTGDDGTDAGHGVRVVDLELGRIVGAGRHARSQQVEEGAQQVQVGARHVRHLSSIQTHANNQQPSTALQQSFSLASSRNGLALKFIRE